MKVTVYHNVSRDASFGLNTVLDSNGKFYEGGSHELVKVFEFDASELIDPDVEVSSEVLADVAFRAFNVGHEQGYYRDEREHELAVKYRARKLRSLRVGDVVCDSGVYLACESVGWTEVQAGELRVLSARAAESFIRRRYDITGAEELNITVPLAD